MAHPAQVMMPFPASTSQSCGCGQQSAAQQYYSQPYEQNSLMPHTNVPTVPTAPTEFRAPLTSGSAEIGRANGMVDEGPVPVPPSDTFRSEPPLPLNVEPPTTGAPQAAPLVDPVSWEIPAN